jgi:hypothetical protein
MNSLRDIVLNAKKFRIGNKSYKNKKKSITKNKNTFYFPGFL